ISAVVRAAAYGTGAATGWIPGIRRFERLREYSDSRRRRDCRGRLQFRQGIYQDLQQAPEIRRVGLRSAAQPERSTERPAESRCRPERKQSVPDGPSESRRLWRLWRFYIRSRPAAATE